MSDYRDIKYKFLCHNFLNGLSNNNQELNYEQSEFLIQLLKNAIDFQNHVEASNGNISLEYKEKLITDIYKFNTIVPHMPAFYQDYLIQCIGLCNALETTK